MVLREEAQQEEQGVEQEEEGVEQEAQGVEQEAVVVVAVVVVDEGVGLEDGECKNLCSSLRTHTRS